MLKWMLLWVPVGLWGLVSLSCNDTNYLAPLSDKSSEAYLLEEAKIQIDAENYQKAIEILSEISSNSNERSIMMASAILGAASLGLLDIVKTALNTTQSEADSSSSNQGTDSFLDNIDVDSVFSTGEVRTARIASLNLAINTLKAAPLQTTGVKNLSCVLAGLLATPTIVDGKLALTAATDNLSQILENAQGAGSSAGECPGISEFETNIATISEVQANIAAVLETVNDCPILNFEGDDLNSIEQSFNNLTTNADRGCQTVSCEGPLCDALKLNCVASLIDSSGTSTAGDGVLATCELLQNCLDPDACF